MLNLSSYPQCLTRLRFQRVNFNEEAFTLYWAAACVAFDLSDSQLTEYGGFDFNDRSDNNGKRLLRRLEEFLTDKAQHVASNSVFASEGLKAFLGSRGIKTSALKNEDDFWVAAEILFPGKISRVGGFSTLYVQISSIPKKERQKLSHANLRNVPPEWLGKITERRAELAGMKQGKAA